MVSGRSTSLRCHGLFSFPNASIFVILHNTTEHCHIQALLEPFSISSSQFPGGFLRDILCQATDRYGIVCGVFSLFSLLTSQVPQSLLHTLFHFPSETKMLFNQPSPLTLPPSVNDVLNNSLSLLGSLLFPGNGPVTQHLC